jgi:hypothetical protein
MLRGINLASVLPSDALRQGQADPALHWVGREGRVGHPWQHVARRGEPEPTQDRFDLQVDRVTLIQANPILDVAL